MFPVKKILFLQLFSRQTWRTKNSQECAKFTRKIDEKAQHTSEYVSILRRFFRVKLTIIADFLLGVNRCLFFFIIIGLVGCTDNIYSPPVETADHSFSTPGSNYYRVQKGDTLYSVAWAFGLDYRALAAANHLSPSYNIYPGEKLKLVPKVIIPGPSNTEIAAHPSLFAAKKPLTKRAVVNKVIHNPQPLWQELPQPRWQWPVQGRILQRFSNTLAGNKGVNISGHRNEPVHASASGVVVYSGDGIRGYGNLIIIKHNNSYLSAYAYNQCSLVKLGQRVWQGEPIATMGSDDGGRVMLHFEIRKNGQPVNPLHYLPKR